MRYVKSLVKKAMLLLDLQNLLHTISILLLPLGMDVP